MSKTSNIYVFRSVHVQSELSKSNKNNLQRLPGRHHPALSKIIINKCCFTQLHMDCLQRCFSTDVPCNGHSEEGTGQKLEVRSLIHLRVSDQPRVMTVL